MVHEKDAGLHEYKKQVITLRAIHQGCFDTEMILARTEKCPELRKFFEFNGEWYELNDKGIAFITEGFRG